MTFQPYRSPSTGCRVRAVLFDTFGTVVDWRTGVARQAAAFAAAQGQDLDAEAFADDWRALYQPAMEAIPPDPARSPLWTNSTAKTWTRYSAATTSIRPG
ncbi:hypothetical protein AB4Y86_14270 [Arthrobacter sp. 2YAF22_2]|uniref:hypothetical protein n=1 Tax=Arthrobacter sp. 2YAF22_2 TaxID=3233029 RepID=UPI003F8F817C